MSIGTFNLESLRKSSIKRSSQISLTMFSYVFQISCTILVLTSGISSGTKLPQHLITSRDCELVAVLLVRISSKISSRSRREILPDRRTSWSSRFKEFSNVWFGIDALIVAKFLQEINSDYFLSFRIFLRGYFLSFDKKSDKLSNITSDNALAAHLVGITNNYKNKIVHQNRFSYRNNEEQNSKKWCNCFNFRELTLPCKHTKLQAIDVTLHIPGSLRGSCRQKGIWRIFHFVGKPFFDILVF